MSRLKEIIYDEMTTEQKSLHDEILAGPRSRIAGPMNGWFRNPELGSLIQKVGAYCRYNTSLDPKLSELTILIVARHWNQSVEWNAHQPLALKAGLKPEVAEAINDHQNPLFDDKKEEIIYELATSILENKTLDDKTYRKALGNFGETTLFELTSIIGYYSCIAIQMNCFDVRSSNGDKPQLKV